MTQSMRMRVELISKYSPKPPHIPNSILSVSDLHNLFDIFQSTPFYPAICRAVRPPSQNSTKEKKLGGDQLLVKARLVRADDQWGINKTPTDQSFTL